MSRVAGTSGQLVSDFLYSFLYFLAVVLLVMKARFGGILAQAILAISTLVFAFLVLTFEIDFLRRAGTPSLSLRILSFVCYAVLTYALARSLKRSQVPQPDP